MLSLPMLEQMIDELDTECGCGQGRANLALLLAGAMLAERPCTRMERQRLMLRSHTLLLEEETVGDSPLIRTKC